MRGRLLIPINVAVWLEALAAFHEEHPLPEGWDPDRQRQALAARIVYAVKPSRRW